MLGRSCYAGTELEILSKRDKNTHENNLNTQERQLIEDNTKISIAS